MCHRQVLPPRGAMLNYQDFLAYRLMRHYSFISTCPYERMAHGMITSPSDEDI